EPALLSRTARPCDSDDSPARTSPCNSSASAAIGGRRHLLAYGGFPVDPHIRLGVFDEVDDDILYSQPANLRLALSFNHHRHFVAGGIGAWRQFLSSQYVGYWRCLADCPH